MIESFENKKVASIFLLREDGALLLQHRDDKPGLPLAGMWAPPGGHCDGNERLEDCARRELMEETGYKCQELNLLGTFTDDSIENQPYQLTVFWLPYDGAQSLNCFEGQAMEFIERQNIHAYKIPSYLIGIWDLALAASNRPAVKKTFGGNE